VQRYLVDKTTSHRVIWRFNNKARAMPPSTTLRVETRAAAIVHWSVDGWKAAQDSHTQETGLGTHVADLPSEQLVAGSRIDFALYWLNEQRWEGIDFRVEVER